MADLSRPARSRVAPPTYELERELTEHGATLIAGVDEVGRGAWAGPVLVCAAVTDGSPAPAGLTDSKRLSPKRRVAMADLVRPWVRDHAFGRAEPAEIDEFGMTESLRLAATRALNGLAERPDSVILDGKHDFLGRPWQVRTQIKADLTCVTVAAASVLAKVERDTMMAALDEEYPGYGFASAAGYPSPLHRATLADLGPTPYHRMSWAYLDDLPKWQHLRTFRSAPGGQLSLL
ncbi:ribonuclease HII [Nocardiopsis ansamitocini]|nr:ribonuclease HII [Nocardiopsis ansamitocini]